MEKFTFIITPLNEGQELNYIEHIEVPIKGLYFRCRQIQEGLQKLLPKGTFDVKIEDQQLNRTWYFRDGKFFDDNWNEIKMGKNKVTRVYIPQDKNLLTNKQQ
jgi:hypothetical protein